MSPVPVVAVLPTWYARMNVRFASLPLHNLRMRWNFRTEINACGFLWNRGLCFPNPTNDGRVWVAAFCCGAKYINIHLLFRWYCLLTAVTHSESEERFSPLLKTGPQREG